MKRFTYLVVFSVSLVACDAQSFEPRGNDGIRVGFYNVENLFDTENDSTIRDDAFTPDGDYRWTDYRLKKKTTDLAKVIRNIGGWEPVEVIGFCEVENRSVLEALARHPILQDVGYEIAHIESPDWRGIDVAAFYRPDKFELLYMQAVPVRRADKPDFSTRDILYLKGLALDDTLHLFFNHWPSRYGGQAKSEPNRFAAAASLKAIIDSIEMVVSNAAILVMGDFNDEWDNASLLDTLGAKPSSQASGLVNLMADMPTNIGSYRYRGDWGYLDQAIANQALWNGTGTLCIHNQQAYLLQEDYLMEDDDKYPGKKPYRTYLGMRYHGGYSDHLPIFLDVVRCE